MAAGAAVTSGMPATGARPRPPLAPVRAAPRVWAVASGKGGVGKSVVASNLAAALAAGSERCAIVDLDLGAANLHALFGLRRAPATLSDFLRGDAPSLAPLLCQTSVPGVRLVSGARALLDMANPRHSQKQKLLRHLRRLPVEHVVLDLGAGSSFNVLDFFLAADRRVLVVTPEPTARDNAYQFLKAGFFRSLRSVARHPRVRAALESVLEDARRCARSPRDLVESAAQRDPEAGRALRARAAAFAPWLLVNQVERLEERLVGAEMNAACEAHLGAALPLLGHLPRDPGVPLAVARGVPVLQLLPGCRFSAELRGVIRRLRSGLAPQAAPPPVPPRRPQAVPLPPLDLVRPGAYLRRCRERLGLELDDLAQRTRIRRLAEIEAERFEALPPEPYLGAQVRLYAQTLGIRAAGELAARFSARARHRLA